MPTTISSRILAPLAVIALALVAAGCFDVPKPAVAFLCGTGGDCPDDYECRADGCCHRVGSTGGMCAIIDASVIDAGDCSGCDAPPSPDAAADAMVDANVPIEIVSLLPSPQTVTVAGTAPLTVTIDQTAPVGGVTIGLQSGDSLIATVPTDVTVVQGDTMATFDVTGVALGSTMVTATLGADTAIATVDVN